jgi:radical SAM protein with 4Fe4S-binding SPASM domain
MRLVLYPERVIDLPWVLKLEMTHGCNLSCSFCPIHTLREQKLREFLSPELCDVVGQQYRDFKPKTRIELTMRGEPTLNPYLETNVTILRQYLPEAQISLFTNGLMLLDDVRLTMRLLAAGVNILNVDCYNNSYEKFSRFFDEHYRDVHLEDFREFTAYKYHRKGYELKVINLVPDIADKMKLVPVREIHNYGGSANSKYLEKEFGMKPLTESMRRQCGRPFRECVITNDGDVIICCLDWKKESILGNVKDTHIRDIWYSHKHLDILKDMYIGDRSKAPCASCNYNGGYRLGLLKNPFQADIVSESEE